MPFINDRAFSYIIALEDFHIPQFQSGNGLVCQEQNFTEERRLSKDDITQFNIKRPSYIFLALKELSA
jgi:hypothetical protein